MDTSSVANLRSEVKEISLLMAEIKETFGSTSKLRDTIASIRKIRGSDSKEDFGNFIEFMVDFRKALQVDKSDLDKYYLAARVVAERLFPDMPI